jgi:hypothetical protein
MQPNHSLRVGQKPPAGSTVYLMRSNYSGAPTTIEYFAADDNPDWVTEPTREGFYYGYSTEAELDARIAEYV